MQLISAIRLGPPCQSHELEDLNETLLYAISAPLYHPNLFFIFCHQSTVVLEGAKFLYIRTLRLILT